MDIPSFKDICAADVTRSFLDPETFGEEHAIDGKTMVIVLDDNESVEREKRMKSSMDGIFARKILFYVAANDFGPLPSQGAALRLDEKIYTVVDATDESGVYAITIEANQARRVKR